MIKTFVLDTNILIEDPRAIYGFDDNDVVITSTVAQELDKHKKDSGEIGYNVRTAIRLIHELVETAKSPFDTKFTLENKGHLILHKGSNNYILPKNYDPQIADNRILNDILLLSGENEKKETILVTNDISMQLSARVLGIKVESYKNSQIVTNEDYTGRRELIVNIDTVNLFKDLKGKEVLADGIDIRDILVLNEENTTALYHENEYFILKTATEDKVAAQYKQGKLYPVNLLESPYGIKGRNIGQNFAIHALLSSVDDIPLVILEGKAGTAKTFLSLACGLEGVYERNTFKKIVYTRANQLSDKDHGYLKGDLREKMAPLLGPAYDNLEALIAGKSGFGEDYEQVRFMIEDMFDTGVVEALSMAYMRGRSITDAYIIVDEAQNCSRGQIYDIITRAGAGTKVILCGDASQIDNPLLDKRNNGLVFAIEKMKDSSLCAQVTFNEEGECVRSPLAAEASKLLSK